MQDSLVNFRILNSVTRQIVSLTKEYSQIKGTEVSFLEVFQSDQLHRTAKQIKGKRLFSACLFVCLYVLLRWKQLSFTRKVFVLVWDGGNRIKVKRHGIWFFLTQLLLRELQPFCYHIITKEGKHTSMDVNLKKYRAFLWRKVALLAWKTKKALTK